MYKDKEKQREANRQAKARYKAKQGIPDRQGIPGIPEQGIPIEPVPVSHGLKGITKCSSVIPEQPKPQSYNPMMVGYVPKRGGLV